MSEIIADRSLRSLTKINLLRCSLRCFGMSLSSDFVKYSNGLCEPYFSDLRSIPIQKWLPFGGGHVATHKSLSCDASSLRPAPEKESSRFHRDNMCCVPREQAENGNQQTPNSNFALEVARKYLFESDHYCRSQVLSCMKRHRHQSLRFACAAID